MSQIEQWFEETFKPWKKQMDHYNAEKKAQIEVIQKNAHTMQAIVCAVLEGKTSQAVHLWNQLGLKPALKEIKLDEKTESIILRGQNGKAINMNIDDLLEELDRLY